MSDDLVPVVDLDAPDAAARIDAACRNVGFLSVVNHHIPPPAISRMLDAADRFFAQPLEAKLALVPVTPEHDRGYGGGYRDGEYISISASLKGRIWSHAMATGLKEWCDWCDRIGDKLLDDTISIEQVIGQFILPKTLEARPEGVLLAVEWPWLVRDVEPERLELALNGVGERLVDVDIVPYVDTTSGPLKFTFTTDAWSVPYQAAVVDERLQYSCAGDRELHIRTRNTDSALSQWLNEHGLLFILDRDRLIEGDLLYEANHERDPYDKAKLVALDWDTTDIAVESQGPERLTNSIQYKVVEMLKAESPAWDIIIDDDGSGEIADVVAMRVEADSLHIRFVHRKYSSEAEPGARVKDLYEVCGQAQKSIIWRKADLVPFFKALGDRARKKRNRTGVDPFEVGDLPTLYRLQEQALILSRQMEFVVVQPGLSAAAAQPRHLELLASTEAYLMSTANGEFAVWCSA